MLGFASHSPEAVNRCDVREQASGECVVARRFFQWRGDIDVYGQREKVTV